MLVVCFSMMLEMAKTQQRLWRWQRRRRRVLRMRPEKNYTKIDWIFARCYRVCRMASERYVSLPVLCALASGSNETLCRSGSRLGGGSERGALEADQPRDTTNQKEAGAIIKVMSRIINNNKQKLKGEKASKGILRSTTKHTGDAGTVDSWCRSRVLYCCWYHSLDHVVFGTARVHGGKFPLVTVFSFCVECEEVLRVDRNDIQKLQESSN